MNAESFLQAGDLQACKEQLFKEIKQDPSNVKLRIFLFQLSCINADFDRAKNQLDVIRDLDDESLALVNTYEQLIDCENKRIQVLSGDRTPSCFGDPSEWLAYYVQAFDAFKANNIEGAFKLINEGAELAPEISGTIDGEHTFNWLSDGDVRFGPAFEIMLNGGYYWLPIENIKKLEFEPVEDLRDLVWRPVNLTLSNNGQLIGFVPVRYPIQADTNDTQRLARICDWQEPIENFYIGHGQRIIITDQGEYPLLDITTIEFTQP